MPEQIPNPQSEEPSTLQTEPRTSSITMVAVSAVPKSFERSTVEAYVFGGASLMSYVFTATWIRLLCIIVLLLVSVDVVLRSSIAARLNLFVRGSLLCICCCGWSYAGWSFQKDALPLRVRFIEPKVFPWWKRLEVRWFVNRHHDKLLDLGIPVSSEVSPIQTLITQDTGKHIPFPNGLVFTSGPQSWRRFVRIDPRDPVSARAVGGAYIAESIDDYIGIKAPFVTALPILGLSLYLACSFDSDSSGCSDGFAHSLWQTRVLYGAAFTDQMAADAIKALHEESEGELQALPSVSRRIIQIGCEANYSDDGERLREIFKLMDEDHVR